MIFRTSIREKMKTFMEANAGKHQKEERRKTCVCEKL